ncbi:hypothetical protein FQN55_000500 [Onygenales sp. PD_40]|nr:hypothetical protein FQN55_000500 [Onygenales sp. PD_40]KAK2779206.1 hypothetical protein FQN52_002502 [Onygenales sp. PD_12]KAK2786078.1 hypothetical protein FQN53_006987 [Emmonsiellopsis sp. PD_33]KAK2799214.1 hypothetical protein FQN51_007044 [Onygenales sp. PD_10]
MSLPITSFPSSALPHQVQLTSKGFVEKRRKGPPVDLSKCALLEMVQYVCNPPDEGVPEVAGQITIRPVVRLFRRCANGLTVETTAWDRRDQGKAESGTKADVKK